MSHSLLLISLLLTLTPASAVDRRIETTLRRADFPGSQEPASQAPRTPSPEEFLGYPLGSRWTPHHRLLAYCRKVAETSERVTFQRYGETWEGRPLALLVVTSPERHRRLEEVRREMRKVADPRLLAEDEDIEEVIADLPVVVWLSYNVHGNEASSSEAAMKVLHRLATAGDPQTMKWLQNAVVLMDPCLNPDGRDRYVNWFNGMVGTRPNPDLQAMEHREPWPGGRTNHYSFDLNRDWAFATQKETRARLPLFLSWTPQVHVDYHEMGLESTYFFFPAEKPINSNLPEHTLKWGRIFGRGNAAAFDERGWSYYTGESFDLFYPGYGDSWPSFTGAIGMTYEQAGHGRAGLVARRRDGSLLTLKDRLEHHALSSFSTIDTAVSHRLELLRDYHEFRRSALEEGRNGPVRAWLLPPGGDPGRLRALVDTLRLQGIEVSYATRSFTLDRVRTATGAVERDRTFERGTAVVSLEQPMKRLAKTLLEPRTEIRELYFYDISAWSLPLAFGVEALESPVRVTVPLSRDEPAPGQPWGVAPGEGRVGWLLPYETRGALEALVDLLSAGLKVRSARKGFAFGSQRFEPGTLVIRRNENRKGVEALLDEVGRRRHVTFLPVASGFTDFGIDLGSGSVVPIVRPQVAVCGGPGISSNSLGATRFLLDAVMHVPHSVVDVEMLASLDLERYSAVVLPEGRVPSSARDNLRRFAGRGGVVVAAGRSAFSLIGGGERAVSRIKAASPPPATSRAARPSRPRWIEERREADRRRQQPGSIFLIELDPGHPLSFGYRAEIAAFKAGTRAFDPTGPGTHVGLFKESPALSGYVSPEALAALKGRAYLSVERRGRGAFVLFADDPNFRGAWRGMTRLFLNAVLLLPIREPVDHRAR